MSARGTMQPELVALLGIDWADEKHVWSLQATNGELEHKPEVVVNES